MEMVGFNAHHCENGLTARGDATRQKQKKQGPLTAQCLAENICKLTQEEMERLFKQMCSFHCLLARDSSVENCWSLLMEAHGPRRRVMRDVARSNRRGKCRAKGRKKRRRKTMTWMDGKSW